MISSVFGTVYYRFLTLPMISPGGFYDGLTLEQALEGVQSFRNEKLVQLLFKLDYIENYASGLNRIFQEYAKEGLTPIIQTASTMFKVTFPNKNYEALYLNPEKHLEDNKSITGFAHNKTKKTNATTIDLNKRNSNIYRIIKQNPGLRSTQLLELLKVTDADITLNIFKKSIKQLSELIEFRGSSKTGGYFIKD